MGTQHHPAILLSFLISSGSPNLQKLFHISPLLKTPAHFPLSADNLASSLAENVDLIRWRVPHLPSPNQPTSVHWCLPFLFIVLGQTILFWLPSNCAFSIAFAFFPLVFKWSPLSFVSSVSSSLMVATLCQYAAMFPKYNR